MEWNMKNVIFLFLTVLITYRGQKCWHILVSIELSPLKAGNL